MQKHYIINAVELYNGNQFNPIYKDKNLNNLYCIQRNENK